MRLILDTSVLIHDPYSIYKFNDDKILIPIYVVMELDVLKDSSKREKSNVSHLARRASFNILKMMNEEPERLEIVSCEDNLSIQTLDQAHEIRYVDLLILKTAVSELEKSDEPLKLLSILEGSKLKLFAQFHLSRVENRLDYKIFSFMKSPQSLCFLTIVER